MPDCLPSSVWAMAWAELYRVFAERQDNENLDLMNSLLNAVITDMWDEIARYRVV